MSFNEWSGDPHKIASTKYHLILVIESAIDICNHVIAKNNFRVPEDYADTFKVMAGPDEGDGALSKTFRLSVS